MRMAIILLCNAAFLAGEDKMFIEPRGRGHRDIALEMTKAIVKECPRKISITQNREDADYRLAITPGATTLYRRDGGVEQIFGVRFMVSRLAKRLCEYLGP